MNVSERSRPSAMEADHTLRIQESLLAFSSEFMVLVDEDARVVAGAGEGLSVLGYSAQDRRGHHIAEDLHPDDQPALLDVMHRLPVEAGGSDVLKVRMRHRNGYWMWFDTLVTTVHNHRMLGNGAVLRLRLIDQKRSTADGPPPAEQRFLSLAEALPTGILSADAKGAVVFCNDAAMRILALPEAAILGRGWLEAIEKSDLPDVVEAAGLVIRNGTQQQATFRINTGMFERWGSARFVPLGSADRVSGWIAAIEDVTDRQCAESKLAFRATHDALTDLPNRTLLEDRLGQACARLARSGGSVAVLFVDVDDFKTINDTLGHRAGDLVLQELARRIAAVLRPSDTVARFGGDEFVAVCEDLYPSDTRKVVARLEAEIGQPIDVGSERVVVGASIGVATTQADTAPAEVLALADQQMYRRKRARRERSS